MDVDLEGRRDMYHPYPFRGEGTLTHLSPTFGYPNITAMYIIFRGSINFLTYVLRYKQNLMEISKARESEKYHSLQSERYNYLLVSRYATQDYVEKVYNFNVVIT